MTGAIEDALLAGAELPTRYDRPPEYESIAVDRDIAVTILAPPAPPATRAAVR